MERLVHASDGKLVSKFDIPGTKVKRKSGLAFNVHSYFPVGEIETIAKPCDRLNRLQDPEREFCHILVAAMVNDQDGAIHHCFHPYRDTLEIVE